MAIFENPNEPCQPQKGVYGWFAQKGDKRITIYIGQARETNSYRRPSTLARGISELQRSVFTSNQEKSKYSTLDTDFIVGTAIEFFEKHGYECIWKHISNDPNEEHKFVTCENPVLQDVNNARIKEVFKAKKQTIGYWKPIRGSDEHNKQKIIEAENEIFTQLLRYSNII